MRRGSGLKRLLFLFKRVGEERGRKTEKRVEEVLKEMLRKGKIERFWQSKPGDAADRQGIDFCVVFPDNREIKFQVKSSERGAEEHRKKHPDIPAIIIPPGETTDQIKKKILSLKFV